jgi:hypothetical protein
MVTTMIDLTVLNDDKDVNILYRSSDDFAYAGYYTNYLEEKPLVALPFVVEAVAQAYLIVTEGTASEILLTPVRNGRGGV